MVKKPVVTKWYDKRLPALTLGILAWALAYWSALLALDTARVIYYGAFFIFIVFGLNRFVKAVRGR